MKIREISRKIFEIGNYYERKSDESKNKRFSFWKAASTLSRELGPDFEVDNDYDFRIFEGIGDGINDRIHAIIRGELPSELLEEAQSRIKESSLIQSIDQHIREVLTKNKILSDDDLRDAIVDDKLHHLVPDDIILKLGRYRRHVITPIVDAIELEAVGSYRRMIPTNKDLDFLIFADSDEAADEILRERMEASGLFFTKANNGKIMRKYMVSYNGITIQCDFKVVKNESEGAAMLHFTGPARRNISTRALVKKKGYTLNEYGLFNKEGVNLSLNKTEQELIFMLDQIGVGVPYEPRNR